MGAALPAYMTPADVATMLQVHERSVLRWAAADATMPVTRVGGRVVRFERAALLRWLERKQPRLARRSAHGATQTGGDAA